jgi:transcriptional regulator with XRE-family HTH domain
MPQGKPPGHRGPAPAGGRWFHDGSPQPPTGVGTVIKLRRTELGLSRRELAERAGLSYPYVAELENGAKQGSPRALEAIATALELRPAELLAWSDDLTETRGMSPSDPKHWRNRRTIDAPSVAAAMVPLAASAESGPAPGGAKPEAGDRLSPRQLAARIDDVLRDADPADAQEALLMALGEERVREIVRDELKQQTNATLDSTTDAGPG